MNNFDLISVIIPCYNAELTLQKCLESVMSQTYPHLEIIIIDDGSTDQTAEIIKKFQPTDPRITAFYQTNSGVSKARNKGIAIAAGKFICFVDSDDWVEANYCALLHQSLTENDADIAVSEAFFEDENGNPAGKNRISRDSTAIYDKQTALKLLLEDKIIQSHPWAKLYKSELLKNISFPENIEAFEDYFIMFKIFSNAEKVVKISRQNYHYIQFENSLSHDLTPKRAYHFYLALMEAYRFSQSIKMNSSGSKSTVRNILKKSLMVLKRIVRQTNTDEMLLEKENIRKGLHSFLQYSLMEIGVENYLYLRFFVHYPEKYFRFIKK